MALVTCELIQLKQLFKEFQFEENFQMHVNCNFIANWNLDISLLDLSNLMTMFPIRVTSMRYSRSIMIIGYYYC